MKKTTLLISGLFLSLCVFAQEWSGIPVPADPGSGNEWEDQSGISDDFNYQFNAVDYETSFGSNKWYNFYHNGWDGPGTTYWKYNHVMVDGDDLVIRASRWDQSNEDNPATPWPNKMNAPDGGISAGCITSNNRVKYPVFVEAKVSVANIALASDVWLLSADDWQEIDIIECYGGADSNNSFFSQFIHLSHHSFKRDVNPILDYQPKDHNSWWGRSDVTSWGEYCWNGGNRKYVRIGVNWIGPKHFEYYVDGELTRVLYDKAFATKNGDTWYYTYSTMTNGQLDFTNGYQSAVTYATGSQYSFSTLQAASNASSVSAIDPYNYQNGNGFTKELDIIINVESQDWHVLAGRTPSDALLNDATKNKLKVDWIRVCKPVPSSGGGSASVTVEAEGFSDTGGTYDDSSSGGPGYGVNSTSSIINYVNAGDWVEYLVNIPEDGLYKIIYDIAAPASGADIEFRVSGTSFNITDVPYTGGWSQFVELDASGKANMTAGNHLIRLTAGGNTWAWNLDKFTLVKKGAFLKATSAVSGNLDDQSPINKLCPNPACESVSICIAESQAAKALIELFDLSGKKVLEEIIETNNFQTIDLSGLEGGVYLVKASNGFVDRLLVVK